MCCSFLLPLPKYVVNIPDFLIKSISINPVLAVCLIGNQTKLDSIHSIWFVTYLLIIWKWAHDAIICVWSSAIGGCSSHQIAICLINHSLIYIFKCPRRCSLNDQYPVVGVGLSLLSQRRSISSLRFFIFLSFAACIRTHARLAVVFV